jgi:hypothetical protein
MLSADIAVVERSRLALGTRQRASRARTEALKHRDVSAPRASVDIQPGSSRLFANLS